MKKLEFFLKNRLNFDCENIIHHNFENLEFVDKSLYRYKSKYFNPLDLNIKNSYDLSERLVSKLYFVVSKLKYLDIDDEYQPFFIIFLRNV